MGFLRTYLGVEDRVGTGFDRRTPAFVADPAIGTNELDAWVSRFAGHDYPVGVPVGDIVIFHGVIKTTFPERAGSLHLHRPATLGVICPLSGVEQMSTPVANDPS